MVPLMMSGPACDLACERRVHVEVPLVRVGEIPSSWDWQTYLEPCNNAHGYQIHAPDPIVGLHGYKDECRAVLIHRVHIYRQVVVRYDAFTHIVQWRGARYVNDGNVVTAAADATWADTKGRQDWIGTLWYVPTTHAAAEAALWIK